MRDYRDAKSMAQTLRHVLSEKNISLDHSESLEIIAKTLGLRHWNTLSAMMQTEQPRFARKRAFRRLKNRATLPAAPLRDIVVFPNTVMSIYAGRERTVRAVEKAMTRHEPIVLIAQKNAADDNPDNAGLHRVGVTASVLHIIENPEGGVVANILGLQRVAVEQFSATGDFYEAIAVPVEEDIGDRRNTKVLARELFQQYQEYAETRSPKLVELLVKPDADPGHLADIVVARLRLPITETQKLLETMSVAKRLESLLHLVRQAKL